MSEIYQKISVRNDLIVLSDIFNHFLIAIISVMRICSKTHFQLFNFFLLNVNSFVCIDCITLLFLPNA